MNYDPYDDEDFDLDDEGISATELVEAMQGNLGEEAQRAAFELTGYELAESDGPVEPTQDAAEFSAQAVRLERQLGRTLTAKEINDLAQDQAGTGPPDVKESYDRVLHRDLSNDEDRHAVMRETMDEANYAQDAGDVEDEGVGAA